MDISEYLKYSNNENTTKSDFRGTIRTVVPGKLIVFNNSYV